MVLFKIKVFVSMMVEMHFHLKFQKSGWFQMFSCPEIALKSQYFNIMRSLVRLH